MLVLSRYKDERIYIGEDIIITIVDVKNGKVRVGIEAPPEVKVFREEIKPKSTQAEAKND